MRGLGLLLLLPLALPVAARAADPVPIGFITTLSGPGGYTGEDGRDAFLLAVAEQGGKLGGIPVKVMVEDDGLKPANGTQIARQFLDRDHAKIMTGIIFSNVEVPVVGLTLDAGAFYISSNAGPSNFVGKGCDKNYFAVSFTNDSLAGSAGALANELGKQRMFILGANYQAGKDALAGFKKVFKGQIVGELYTALTQTDFSTEIAQIRDAKPDAVYNFEPGGQGITFLKQYVQAGLNKTIPLVLSSASMEERVLAAVGDPALGVNVSLFWNGDFPNAENQKFVADFVKTYHRQPTLYAAEAYDTANLIGSALKAVGGDMTKTDAFRAALRKADFKPVRGSFAFASDQSPIQDWYGAVVVRGDDGKLMIKTTKKIETGQYDKLTAECHM